MPEPRKPRTSTRSAGARRAAATGTKEKSPGGNRSPSRGGGPKGHKGRQVAARNAISHGLWAESPVIPGESQRAWEDHLQGYRESIKPGTYYEEVQVYNAAGASWRLRRLDGYEHGVIVNQFEALADPGAARERWLHNAEVGMGDWFNTDPSGALEVFIELFVLDEDTQVPADVFTAGIVAIHEMSGRVSFGQWPGVSLVMKGIERPGSFTVRNLRILVEAISSRLDVPQHEFFRGCLTLLYKAALHQDRLDRLEMAFQTQGRRLAIIPAEAEQAKIGRARALYERAHKRAMDATEVSQEARAGTLSPPIRIELDGP
jgi:hypothetical protein